jgi:hypothetical protein
MENNEIKIILYKRGKKLANVEAFKYMFIGIRKNGELLKYPTVQSLNVTPIFVLNHVVFEFFFYSYCLIVTVLNWVTKKINRVPAFQKLFFYKYFSILFSYEKKKKKVYNLF